MKTDAPSVESTSPPCRADRMLPHRLRLLYMGATEPPWALLALRLESAGCDQAEFDWQTGAGDALGRLRKTAFDCVIVLDDERRESQQPSVIGIVEALRASGGDDPVIVLRPQPNDELAVRLDELDCEVLVTTSGWQSRALVNAIQRAVARGEARRDMAGLQREARRGRDREREDADVHLQQLRDVVARLVPPAGEAAIDPSTGRDRTSVAARLGRYYGGLLRTYVMMGTGNLPAELQRLSELLSLSGFSLHETLSMHLDQVESLIRGLGGRSSRHIMARADLLVLELTIQLAETYRRKARSLTNRGLGDAGVDLLHASSLLQRPEDPAA